MPAAKRERGRPKGSFKLPAVLAAIYWERQDLVDEITAHGFPESRSKNLLSLMNQL
jgi:hypothetical protein